MGLPAKRVLIVEDELLIAMSLADMVEDMGAAPLGPALSLVHGLELLGQEKPDAALLDVDLNGSLVWPLAERLKNLGVPYALVSARCCQAGFMLPEGLETQFKIPKPCSYEGISEALSAMLQPLGLLAD